MGEFSVEYIADDFHVAVTMRGETAPGCHTIFVDHAQRPDTHEARIEIVGEREGVPRIEPAVVGVAAFFTTSYLQHAGSGDEARCYECPITQGAMVNFIVPGMTWPSGPAAR